MAWITKNQFCDIRIPVHSCVNTLRPFLGLSWPAQRCRILLTSSFSFSKAPSVLGCCLRSASLSCFYSYCLLSARLVATLLACHIRFISLSDGRYGRSHVMAGGLCQSSTIPGGQSTHVPMNVVLAHAALPREVVRTGRDSGTQPVLCHQRPQDRVQEFFLFCCKP